MLFFGAEDAESTTGGGLIFAVDGTDGALIWGPIKTPAVVHVKPAVHSTIAGTTRPSSSPSSPPSFSSASSSCCCCCSSSSSLLYSLFFFLFFFLPPFLFLSSSEPFRQMLQQSSAVPVTPHLTRLPVVCSFRYMLTCGILMTHPS